MPAALSLITTGFPEGRTRTRALGLYGATASLGFVAGQVLGGVLVEFTSWRAVFLVNVPVGLIAALAAPKLLGHSSNLRDARAGHRLDVRGALLITVAVALAVFAVSEGNAFGWLSPAVLAAAAVAIVAGAAFALAEARHPEPLIRLSMFRHAGLRRGSALALLMGLWNGGEMLVLSLYFQQVLHESPLVAGLAIAPQGMAGFTAGMYGTQLAARFGGVRRLLAVTAAASAAGFLVLTQLPAAGYSPLLLAVMLIGFGTAGTAFGSIVIASRGVPDSDQGVVGGMINTSRQIGAAIGDRPAAGGGRGHRAGRRGRRDRRSRGDAYRRGRLRARYAARLAGQSRGRCAGTAPLSSAHRTWRPPILPNGTFAGSAAARRGTHRGSRTGRGRRRHQPAWSGRRADGQERG